MINDDDYDEVDDTITTDRNQHPHYHKHQHHHWQQFLVEASPSFDVWSFGLLMYYMLNDGNERLFTVDNNGDLSKRANNLFQYRMMIEMSDEMMAVMIDSGGIKDDNARDLLKMILRTKPNDRPSLTKILV